VFSPARNRLFGPLAFPVIFQNLRFTRIEIRRNEISIMVVGSIIARLGSKRLPYKNLLPYKGVPLVRRGVEILKSSSRVDLIVVSTESELIARTVEDMGVHILRRPDSLAGDNIPSVPVFQHIVGAFPCDVHVNYNINFPNCDPAVVDRAVGIAEKNQRGEALSVPFAVWAQTSVCLNEYGDPWNIRAERFEDARVSEPDVHTIEDLLESHRVGQSGFIPW